MTQPISTVARIAASPEQAKIFVAMLQAEGIPAHTDGDSLADEVAVSRRLMNLGGTRVMVPTASLARAKEILDIGAIDVDDLAAQALAAEDCEVPPAPRAAAAPRKTPWLLIGSMVLAALFLALWLSEVDARASAGNALARYEPIPGGMRETRRADGVVLAEYTDNDANGHFEVIESFLGDGTSTARDDDRDLRWESLVERRGGLVYSWVDTNADGGYDLCRVTDATGKQVQELHYRAGVGFTLQ